MGPMTQWSRLEPLPGDDLVARWRAWRELPRSPACGLIVPVAGGGAS